MLPAIWFTLTPILSFKTYCVCLLLQNISEVSHMNYKAIALVSSWIQHSERKLTASQQEYALCQGFPTSWLLHVVSGCDSCPSCTLTSLSSGTSQLWDVTVAQEVPSVLTALYSLSKKCVLLAYLSLGVFFFSVRTALFMKAILNLEVWLWKNTYLKMLFRHHFTVSYL